LNGFKLSDIKLKLKPLNNIFNNEEILENLSPLTKDRIKENILLSETIMFNTLFDGIPHDEAEFLIGNFYDFNNLNKNLLCIKKEI